MFLSLNLHSEFPKMWKLSIVFGLVLHFAAGRHASARDHVYSSNQRVMNITEMIASNRYPVQTYDVETEDGYILSLIRIPYGIRESQNGYQQPQVEGGNDQYQSSYAAWNHHGNKQQQQQQQNEDNSESESSNSSEETGIHRPAIMLMHGLLSTAEDFVIGGPTQGLAYILADNGYDVFMGNARGSKYSRRHTVLNPDRDPAFWKFCWDDIGMKDLPAMMDKTLEIVEQQQLFYIGHMEGSTVFYVMASEKPKYNMKIRGMISLGPLAFMGRTTNLMMRLVSEKENSKGWIMKNLGMNEFMPSEELMMQGGETDCFAKENNEKICKNVFFLMNGYNSRNLNTTTMMSLIHRLPSGASTKQILHFAQLVKTGRFMKFCMEGTPEEDYKLNRITCPMSLLYTPQDSVSTVEDIEKLSRKLTSLKQTMRIDEYTNNIDLLFGNRVETIVYRKLMRMLRSMENNAQVNPISTEQSFARM